MTTPDVEVPASLRTAWARQSVWSQVANGLKREITWSRTSILVLVVVAALVEVVPATLADSAMPPTTRRVLGWLGAAALSVAALLRLRAIGREQLGKWVRARSASEAIKAEVYLFRTTAGPYAGAADPSGTLSERVRAVVEHVADLETYAATVTPAQREPPGPLDVGQYVERRVNAQIDGYYLKRAREYARLATTFRWIEVGFMAASAVLGALVGLMDDKTIGAWVGLLTTVTGALAAHVEGGRYEHQVVSFRQTAGRLEALRDAFLDRTRAHPPTPDEVTRFVQACEDAISVENEAWMTAWVKAG